MVAKGTPSFLIRLFLLDEQGEHVASNQALFLGLNGNSTVQSPGKDLDFSMIGGDIPRQWTRIEIVFDVPADVADAKLGRPEFFAQYTKGSIYLDDVVFESVGKDVPVTKKH